jgi:L-iditol 2-dehydrogenase
MKIAVYAGNNEVEIVNAPQPLLPAGGLLVQTEVCGLCSGELMGWYMEGKSRPVLGHEVAGRVIESDDPRFAVGDRVFPHHHAPCLVCAECRRGAYVQCATWKATRLEPGGMAEVFGVAKENLTDTHVVNDLPPTDAALTEPLACVVKSLRQGRWLPGKPAAVIGLGGMGLLHMLAIGGDATGFEVNPERVRHAEKLGLKVAPASSDPTYEVVFVCPGNQGALDLALKLVAPRGTIVLFAPFGPSGAKLDLDELYFRDITVATSYSAGPDDVAEALRLLRAGVVKADQLVSDFCSIDELPEKYRLMRDGQILKAMVLFASD